MSIAFRLNILSINIWPSYELFWLCLQGFLFFVGFVLHLFFCIMGCHQLLAMCFLCFWMYCTHTSIKWFAPGTYYSNVYRTEHRFKGLPIRGIFKDTIEVIFPIQGLAIATPEMVIYCRKLWIYLIISLSYWETLVGVKLYSYLLMCIQTTWEIVAAQLNKSWE